MFNSFTWELYKNSEEGREALSKDFSKFTDYLENTEDIFGVICSIFELIEDKIVENSGRGEEIDLREPLKVFASEFNVTNIEEAENFFIQLADKGIELRFENKGKSFILCFGGGNIQNSLYEDIYSSIEGLTSCLYNIFPDYFIPYFFFKRFDQFEKICQFFSISLPEVPGKLKKRDRALYYLHINHEPYEFRIRHELSAKEMVSFLYDFAPKSIFRDKKVEEIFPPPSPSRIWFIIGGLGEGDFDVLDSIDSESRLLWQGNLEMRKGDIVLMWCVSPRSYLHSVWRALGDGYNDPFFYFYSMVPIGNPVKIPPIPFSDFSNHPFLGTRPAVRAHFQGRGGSAFSIEDYAAIMDILQKKGFDTSLLPEPPETHFSSDILLQNERDVERLLVEPFLQHIGLTKNDWIRQFPLRMGRGERNYPDYVLGGEMVPGDERAFAVIECKFHIETKKELKDAFIQAKSYALRLQTTVLILSASRGLWVFQRRKDGFSIDHFIFKTWKELTHPDAVHQLSLIFGRRKIEAAIR